MVLSCVGVVFTMNSKPAANIQHEQKMESLVSATPNVAWAVYELTDSDAAAAVSGTSVAIGTSQAVATAIRGASWGARIGKYAGPWGCLAGAVVGGL